MLMRLAECSWKDCFCRPEKRISKVFRTLKVFRLGRALNPSRNFVAHCSAVVIHQRSASRNHWAIKLPVGSKDPTGLLPKLAFRNHELRWFTNRIPQKQSFQEHSANRISNQPHHHPTPTTANPFNPHPNFQPHHRLKIWRLPRHFGSKSLKLAQNRMFGFRNSC